MVSLYSFQFHGDRTLGLPVVVWHCMEDFEPCCPGSSVGIALIKRRVYSTYRVVVFALPSGIVVIHVPCVTFTPSDSCMSHVFTKWLVL